MGFKITGARGFHITFDNGVTVSVQFGGGSYSDNHDKIDLIGKESERKILESYTAEVALFDKEGWLTKKFKPNSNGDVLGWQYPDDVLEALNWAASITP